jgi:transposase
MRRNAPSAIPQHSDHTPQGQRESRSQQSGLRRRRGTTAMEYLFVISLILTVAITGIGYFGQSTKDTTKKASDAIENATKEK